jgi:hypothetical protein
MATLSAHVVPACTHAGVGAAVDFLEAMAIAALAGEGARCAKELKRAGQFPQSVHVCAEWQEGRIAAHSDQLGASQG